MRIGIDFDNTIIDYSKPFTEQARRLGFIESDETKSKQQVRDFVRALSDGEKKWMKLQGLVYGEFIEEASPFEGVLDFIKRCAKEDIEVFIVSHKTKYLEVLDKEIDLRHAALNWLDKKGFLKSDETELTKNKVFFEHCREDKLTRIKTLRCTCFIDDLRDVLLNPSFPEGVKKILFTQGVKQQHDNLLAFSTWEEIEKEIFR